MVKKIVVTHNMGLYPDQIKRLKSLGNVTFYDDVAQSPEEWVKRCQGADIICCGKSGVKEKIHEMKNVFFSLPFVGISWIDKEKIKKNNVIVSYCPGCNKDAVSEWIIAMMLNLLRQLPELINVKSLPKDKTPEMALGLTSKKVCILGKGNIGSRVGKICKALNTDVSYFKRGDDLIESVKDADVVVDCLGSNPTTWGLLNKTFFHSLKRGSFFITITGPQICDVDAMIEALNKGILVGAAHDAGGIKVGNVADPFYQKLLEHPKVLVTPHISYNTEVRARVSYDMMIDNVEAWIKGKPINLLN